MPEPPTPTPTPPSPTLSNGDGRSWQPVFSDEFIGATLAPHWNTCHWWQTDGGCTIITNAELEWYRPEAVSVRDGALRLRADAIDQLTSDGRSLPFRSGMVTSGRTTSDMSLPPKFAFTYGFVEASMTLPTAAGTWPAFWLLSADNTSLPEIDIMEWYGRRPDLITMHVHQRVNGSSADSGLSIEVPDARGATHVFGLRWTPDEVTFFLDGVESGSITDPTFIPTTPMYLIVNLAIGGGNAGTANPAEFPQELAVDYIRVWQEQS
jgi:beta-glucanase (GH16 family)